jgi:predicted lactoylglutathione lyase
MNRMIFVNLPVADVAVSRAFYTGLGFGVNEDFSDDQVACIVVSDTIFVMLLEHARFRDFITTEIADARTTTQVLNALSAESRAEVDSMVATAVSLGGTARTPMQDGPMYGHSFADPDGHVWELIYMDMAQQS